MSYRVFIMTHIRFKDVARHRVTKMLKKKAVCIVVSAVVPIALISTISNLDVNYC